MITSLSDIYLNVSQQLPGVSTPILDTEFRKAERRVCKETSCWQEDFTFTCVAGTYEYSIPITANAELVLTLELRDWLTEKGRLIDVNYYTAKYREAATVDGYVLSRASENAESNLTGSYTDSGDTYNGETVYTNGTFMAFLATKGVGASSNLYIVCLEADYDALVLDSTDFPTSYYAISPPDSALTGVLEGFGDYAGTVVSDYLGDQGAVVVKFDEAVIDGYDASSLDDFTLTVSLAPRARYTAAPSHILSRFSEAIETAAMVALYDYPRNFPWSDQAKSQRLASDLRHQLGKIKFEMYRGPRRSTVVMKSRGFI